MRDKAIWLFAGGEMQAHCAKTITDLGYKLVLTDITPNCYCHDMADIFIQLDTFDIQGNLSKIEEIQSSVEIAAVLTVAADCHETVSNVASTLNLPGIDPHISHICRYKHKSRELLSDSGIPQPRFKSVSTISDAKKYAVSLDKPFVIKSTDNSGSRGFSYARSADEISTENFNNALTNGTTGKVLIEECLVPLDSEIAEQSVETLWINGQMYWLNWVDRLFRKDFKHFRALDGSLYDDVSLGVEIGHLNPAIHDLLTKERIKKMIQKAGIAIGMGSQEGAHFLKADIMLTVNGPQIIELTPRLSGGWDSSKSTLARGGNFVAAAIQMALGTQIDFDFWDKYFNYENDGLHAAIFAQIKPDARDCIGREFALGTGYDRNVAVSRALQNLKEKKYVLPVE
jgi:S-sulfo-L-cysteine synthase (3-phospho-L-serine-dependent)